jgi:alpha-glucosidase (family GH31 glycosyl hydrolase)
MYKITLLVLFTGLLWPCEAQENNTFLTDFNDNPTWTESYNGVWKSVVNQPQEVNLLNTSGSSPREEALAKIEGSKFPLEKTEIKAFSKNGKTYIRLPLEDGERIFGLGLNFKTVEQRGRIMRLHMDHYGGKDDGRTHAPTPFFVSTSGYGLLINSAKYIDVYMGTGVTKDSKNPAISRDRNTDKKWTAQPKSDNIEIIIPDDGVELILFAGKNIQETVQRFNLYCGGGFIPPKWGLGFWQRTPTLYGEKEVQEEVDSFVKNNFPIDVVGLEPGWHSKSYPCTFEWDKTRFPNPKPFVESMAKQGIHLNSWINPYVSPSSSIYEKIKPFTATHTVWTGIVPDFLVPEAHKIMTDQFEKNVVSVGVSGLKIDEVDGFDRWLWPDYAQFPSGLDGETMRSIYGTLTQKWSADMYRKQNTRTYGLVRAGNVGSVSLPYVIYNDYYKHEDFITALINSSFAGVLWTPEVRSSGSSEDWIRRMQSVCFSPMAMINAWADGTKPWSYPEVYEYCQDVAFLRMQLLPYIYTAFSEYYFKGIPPFRAMAMEEGFTNIPEMIEQGDLNSTDNPYLAALKKEIKDQYMMGESMLVAPMFAGQKTRTVVLPKGKWYDFYTGELIGNGGIITASHGLDKIPLYVKDGAIIPMMKQIRNTSEWGDDTTLEVRVYGNQPNEFVLYDDDGKSYDYEEGSYTQKVLKTTVQKGKLKGSVSKITERETWSYGTVNWNFMTK